MASVDCQTYRLRCRQIRASWKFADALPTFVPGLADVTQVQSLDTVYERIGAFYPDMPLSQFNTRYDKVQATYFQTLGGGDVKLLVAAVLWAGAGATPTLLLMTGVLGGVIALFLLMPLGGQFVASARLMLGHALLEHESGAAAPIPYGVAIAGAAVIVTLQPLLG